MRDDGTTQNKPKRLRQPYFNAQTTQTRAHTSFGPVKRKEGGCMHKDACLLVDSCRRACETMDMLEKTVC